MKTKVILLVDGNESTRAIVKRELSQPLHIDGSPYYQVTDCQNFFDAKRLMTRIKDRLLPDAVVVDIDLPCVQGQETIRSIRAVADSIPVIAICTAGERVPIVTYGATDAIRRDSIGENNEQWAEALLWKVTQAIVERESRREIAAAKSIISDLEKSVQAKRQMDEESPLDTWKQKSDPLAIKAR